MTKRKYQTGKVWKYSKPRDRGGCTLRGAPEYYKYRCSHCHFENTM